MPRLNVENFGLLESSIISVKRSLFGFKEKKYVSEDILNNKRSILSNSDNVKYNEEDISNW